MPSLDLTAIGRLDFEKPDLARFPCLELAYHAIRAGKSAPAILNAANEIAVDAFLRGGIRFTDIAAVVEQALNDVPTSSPSTLEEVLAVDAMARQSARAALGRRDVDAPPTAPVAAAAAR